MRLLSDGGATRGASKRQKMPRGTRQPGKAPEAQREDLHFLGLETTRTCLYVWLAREDGVLDRFSLPTPMASSSFLSIQIGRTTRASCGQMFLRRRHRRRISLGTPLSQVRWRRGGGRYTEATAGREFCGSRVREEPLNIRKDHSARGIPRASAVHRLWASAAWMRYSKDSGAEGKDQATIDEIIRLARQYKLYDRTHSFSLF